MEYDVTIKANDSELYLLTWKGVHVHDIVSGKQNKL